jgi:hypothetical protein
MSAYARLTSIVPKQVAMKTNELLRGREGHWGKQMEWKREERRLGEGKDSSGDGYWRKKREEKGRTGDGRGGGTVG